MGWKKYHNRSVWEYTGKNNNAHRRVFWDDNKRKYVVVVDHETVGRTDNLDEAKAMAMMPRNER